MSALMQARRSRSRNPYSDFIDLIKNFTQASIKIMTIAQEKNIF